VVAGCIEINQSKLNQLQMIYCDDHANVVVLSGGGVVDCIPPGKIFEINWKPNI
jgi:hypothetical protein